MPDRSLSVVVAGAGIGGLTFAIASAQAGVTVDIVERATAPSATGAGIQLSPNAMHVFAALGLGDAIEQKSFPPHRAVIRHFGTGKPLLSTELNPAHEQRYGQKYLHIHRADLLAVLLEAATAEGVQMHYGQHARSFERHADAVTIECGQSSWSADLLVGADGIHSVVRNGLGGETPPRFTGNVAWRGLVPSHRLPQGLLSPDANLWVGPGRHFVAYYVRGGALINFIAVSEQKQWARESWQTPGDVAEVRAAYTGWDPRIGQLLEACDACFLWGLFDRPALPRWHQDRVVLLGDACHPMLPFMAQGAAMAIEDAWVLSQLIIQPALPPARALSQYEKIRQPRTAAVQALSTRNARTYHRSNAVAVGLRNLSFAIGSKLPAVTHHMLDPVYGTDVTQFRSDH